MSENILYENIINETEAGFDSQNPPALPGTAPVQIPINTEGDTNTTDIAQQAPKLVVAQNAISESLPYMISFVQTLNSSVGYIFGLQQKDKTAIPDIANQGDDVVMLRKFVQTKVREVKLEMTNETIQDIQALFGSSFPSNYSKFLASGGEVWDGPNAPLARFFLSMARQRIISKINTDFVTWVESVSTKKGKADIATWGDMHEIIGIISELREALFKNTGKSSSYWLLVSPKIAAFLSTFYGRQHNDSALYTQGRRFPNNYENGYVTTIGDIQVFQYDFYDDLVTGGTESDSESEGKMFMGYKGGAGTSSVYYTPYNEYIVQGGEDFSTGQASVFYRVRDSWETNPLDTYDETLTEPELGTLTQPVPNPNKSQYIVSVDLTFGSKLIQPN